MWPVVRITLRARCRATQGVARLECSSTFISIRPELGVLQQHALSGSLGGLQRGELTLDLHPAPASLRGVDRRRPVRDADSERLVRAVLGVRRDVAVLAFNGSQRDVGSGQRGHRPAAFLEGAKTASRRVSVLPLELEGRCVHVAIHVAILAPSRRMYTANL